MRIDIQRKILLYHLGCEICTTFFVLVTIFGVTGLHLHVATPLSNP